MPENNQIRNSWLPVANDSDFSIHNIPFGIIMTAGGTTHAATRIGDTVIDLAVLAKKGYFNETGLVDPGVFEQRVLNDFIALGKEITCSVRNRISDLFSRGNEEINKDDVWTGEALFDVNSVQVMLPLHIPNYTDFYASEQHATNVGSMFRDPSNALLPNWKHLPVGYHGRASSIVVSGNSIHRPKGQTRAENQDKPVYGPSRQVDFELEMGFVIGKETQLGDTVAVDKAEEYIFGLVLFNDLSARDIQKWEYVPLGPFLGKNFGSVISPWIVTLDALEPFRIAGPTQEPKVLPYLQNTFKQHFDIRLEVELAGTQTEVNSKLICRSNLEYLYWSFAQMLAHHTVNGCNIEVGDIYATGTISGPEPGSFGSMLEITWKGEKPIQMPDGSTRKFLEDHDTIVMKGYGNKDGLSRKPTLRRRKLSSMASRKPSILFISAPR